MSCQGSASASLLDHIATRGFQKGLGSDVTVSAFGHEYHLHRLILMQSKFFESLFVGQWLEQGSQKVVIRFDDPCISRQCFEVVLACLYGITITEEDGHSDGNDSGGGSRECKLEEEGRASLSSGVSTNDNTSYASPCTSMPQWTAVASEASAAIMASQRRSTPSTSTDNGCNARLSMANVLGVLACASYLQVQGLCAQCTRYVIRIGVTMQYVVTLARFCQRHSYYPWTDNIQAACEVYLCRNLWENPTVECYRVLERLPASCLRRVLASDALWIPSEWERYKLCRQVVFRRRALWAARNYHRCCIYEAGCQPAHQQRCTESTALEPELPTDNIDGRCSKADVGAGATVVSIPYDDTADGQDEDRLGMDSNGKNGVQKDMASESDECEEEEEEEEEAVYHEIFARGIHYMYLSFEQLQHIRRDIDPWTGEPFTPGRVVHEALWHQIELRARIDASKSQDSSELGILIPPPPSVTQTCQPSSSVADEYKSTTKATASEPSVEEKTEGGLANEMLTSLSRSSGSRYAPFRFSVEFGNLHKLGSKMRMYSKLVFYAGSFWNVYIQKHESVDANGSPDVKLGVYLHRHSIPLDTLPRVDLRAGSIGSLFWSSPTATLTAPSATTERSHSQQSSSRTNQNNNHNINTNGSSIESHELQGQPKGNNHLLNPRDSQTQEGVTAHRPLGWQSPLDQPVRTASSRFASCTDGGLPSPSCPHTTMPQLSSLSDLDSVTEVEGDGNGPDGLFGTYADTRERTKTWFKVYCASLEPAHHMLVLEGSTEQFAVRQSWGWRVNLLASPLYISRNDSHGENISRCKGEGWKSCKEIVGSLSWPDQHQGAHYHNLGARTLRFSIVMGHA